MKIVIATYMDWDAIYIDGICKVEDHTLRACDVEIALEGKLPCIIESIKTKSVDEHWWCEENRDNYPKNIEDVIFEKEQE